MDSPRPKACPLWRIKSVTLYPRSKDAVVENAIHRCSDNQTHLCSILIKADGRFTRSAVAWPEPLPRKSSTGRLRIIDVVSHKQVRAARHQEFLFSQGITDHDPLRKDRRSRLGQLTTGTSPRNPPGRGNGRPFAGPPEGAIPQGAEEERIRGRQGATWRPLQTCRSPRARARTCLESLKPLCLLNLRVASSRG